MYPPSIFIIVEVLLKPLTKKISPSSILWPSRGKHPGNTSWFGNKIAALLRERRPP
jgi:hypothetical protein